MTIEYQTKRRIEFSETDMAGIAHFSNFFRYMEEAEHQFLRSVGLNVVLRDDYGTLGFPKLQAECRYHHPASHDAEIDILLQIDWEDGKTIHYECLMTGGEVKIATGFVKVACCRFPPNRLPYAIPLPDFVLQSLKNGPRPTS